MSRIRDYQAVSAAESSANQVPNGNAIPPTRGFCGSHVLSTLTGDAWLLIMSKSVRMFSYGFLAVMLVIFMQENGFTGDQIGSLLTLTLLGDAVISIFLASHADRWGRRSTLLIGSLFAISTSFIFATQSNYYLLLITGIIGVISPSGSEIGPFMAIELSALAQVTSDHDRTSLMAWYNLFGSFASASGALTCGAILDVLQSPSYGSYSLLAACRSVMILYGLVQTLQALFFTQLSSAIEVPVTTAAMNKPANLPSFMGLHKSRTIVIQLSLLFMLDSFAGSFVLQSIISAWFYNTYRTPSTALGSVVFYCNIVAGISALFAVEIANRIGLMMTMVVTHMPSNVLLMLVPIMPTQLSSMIMLGARYSISQMDVPTRNAYVQSVVDADERSAANGVTNVVRSIGASTGPYLAGLLMERGYMNYPFYIAGGLKIVYDLLLLFNFALSKTNQKKEGSSAIAAKDNDSNTDNRYNVEEAEAVVDEEKIELIAMHNRM